MIDRQTQITICCELSDAINTQDIDKLQKVLITIQELEPYPYKRFGFLEQHYNNEKE